MDEIYGYLPPTAVPPSKGPLLRMLKQARAFGLGLLLATQNPVDMDYKALSNTGTWFIGKLQTERDKNRLLDGLESAAAAAFPRAEMDKLISSLGKRVFVMHNVHEKMPVLIQTRWTMNFLAGPMTRAADSCSQSIGGRWSNASRRARTCLCFENSVQASAFCRRPAACTNAVSISTFNPSTSLGRCLAICQAFNLQLNNRQSSIVKSSIRWKFNQAIPSRRHPRILPPAELQPARSISIRATCHVCPSHDPGSCVSSLAPRRCASEIA